MAALSELKTNGHAAEPVTHAWEARLTAIERQLTAIAESGEQRVVMLRDAIADFAAAELAKRDEEIVSLKKQLAEFQQKLEQQAAIDQRVHEISTRSEEAQARRDRGKNGITDGDFIQTMSMLIAQERQSARTEFKAADEEMQRALEAKLAEMEQRCKAVPGKLPPVKTWREGGVIYQGEIATLDGALWQARCDTGQRPGDSDWVCVARAGRDAITPTVCGNFDAHESYAELDIVSYDGGAYIARHDNPGIPGHGDCWQPLSQRGGESVVGPRGEKGDAGARGEPGRTIVSWKIDDERYRVIGFYENGEPGPELNLRPLFERFIADTGYPGNGSSG